MQWTWYSGKPMARIVVLKTKMEWKKLDCTLKEADEKWDSDAGFLPPDVKIARALPLS